VTSQSSGLILAKRISLIVAGMIAAAGLGWLSSRHLAHGSKSLSPRQQLEQQSTVLLTQQQQQDLSPQDQQKLLEQLLVLGRYPEAQALLEDLASKRPETILFGLMLAELKRSNGELQAAQNEINRLLTLNPENFEVIKMKTMLDLEAGHERDVITELNTKFENREKGKRLPLGLLLADVLRQANQKESAAKVYRLLAKEDLLDARPLLALAMLRQEQGKGQQAQRLLREARARRTNSNEPDPLIDGLASQWGLISTRKESSGSQSAPKANSGLTTKPDQTPPRPKP
jgi:tetratricopeptide (TPR) repeat protein